MSRRSSKPGSTTRTAPPLLRCSRYTKAIRRWRAPMSATPGPEPSPRRAITSGSTARACGSNLWCRMESSSRVASTTTPSGATKRLIMAEISNPLHLDLTVQGIISRTLQNGGVRLMVGAALLLAAHAAFGQSTTHLAILEGTIRNEAGQVSPNATVVVANERGRTDETGHYSIQVPVGRDLVESRSVRPSSGQ